MASAAAVEVCWSLGARDSTAGRAESGLLGLLQPTMPPQDGTADELRHLDPLVHEPLSGSVFGRMYVRAILDAR